MQFGLKQHHYALFSLIKVSYYLYECKKQQNIIKTNIYTMTKNLFKIKNLLNVSSSNLPLSINLGYLITYL